MLQPAAYAVLVAQRKSSAVRVTLQDLTSTDAPARTPPKLGCVCVEVEEPEGCTSGHGLTGVRSMDPLWRRIEPRFSTIFQFPLAAAPSASVPVDTRSIYAVMGSETVHGNELRRLEFVKTTSESVFSNTFKIAHSLYSSLRTRVPGSVDKQITSVESKVTELTAPQLNKLQDVSGELLTYADGKVAPSPSRWLDRGALSSCCRVSFYRDFVRPMGRPLLSRWMARWGGCRARCQTTS